MKQRKNKSASSKVKYTDEPINAKVIDNFLPGPGELVFKEKKKRVTITLSERSLNFFKKEAKKHKASYQGMIRRLLDYYVINQ